MAYGRLADDFVLDWVAVEQAGVPPQRSDWFEPI